MTLCKEYTTFSVFMPTNFENFNLKIIFVKQKKFDICRSKDSHYQFLILNENPTEKITMEIHVNNRKISNF